MQAKPFQSRAEAREEWAKKKKENQKKEGGGEKKRKADDSGEGGGGGEGEEGEDAMEGDEEESLTQDQVAEKEATEALPTYIKVVGLPLHYDWIKLKAELGKHGGVSGWFVLLSLLTLTAVTYYSIGRGVL